jgi:hypothetical protein
MFLPIGQLRNLRTEMGSTLTAQLYEPAMLACPGKHFDFFAELIICFAGILACLKAETPNHIGDGRAGSFMFMIVIIIIIKCMTLKPTF